MHAGVQSTPGGYPQYCLKALGVPYPIVYSIRVSTQSTVCEYQECQCERTSTRVVSKCPGEYSQCSLLVLSVPHVSPPLANIEPTEYRRSECPL